MAYESVKNQIDAYIKANGVNLITGTVLNAVLTTMLDELGEGYAFQGVLNTTDTPSPAADIPQAWLASAGTYLGGSITVDEGELALIIHTSDGWSKETVYRGVQLSYEAIVAALGYTPADDADLAEKQDTIADLSDIRSGAALGSTSVQPVDIENMKEELSQLGQELPLNLINKGVVSEWDGFNSASNKFVSLIQGHTYKFAIKFQNSGSLGAHANVKLMTDTSWSSVKKIIDLANNSITAGDIVTAELLWSDASVENYRLGVYGIDSDKPVFNGAEISVMDISIDKTKQDIATNTARLIPIAPIGFISVHETDKIAITDTTITIPKNTRIVYGLNGFSYTATQSSATVINRDSNFEQFIVFNIGTKTIVGRGVNTVQTDDVILFLVQNTPTNKQKISLHPSLYTYNGKAPFVMQSEGLYKTAQTLSDSEKTQVLTNLGIERTEKGWKRFVSYPSKDGSVSKVPDFTNTYAITGVDLVKGHKYEAKIVAASEVTAPSDFNLKIVSSTSNSTVLRIMQLGGLTFTEKTAQFVWENETVGDYRVGFYGNGTVNTKIEVFLKDVSIDAVKDAINVAPVVDRNRHKEAALISVASKNGNENIKVANKLTLLHFSDLHGNTANLANIVTYGDHYADLLDDIIHTGDSVLTQMSDANPFVSVEGAGNILNVIGNHEAWVNTSDPDYYATEKQTYDKIFAPSIANWGVVQPTGAAENGYCYYYKDFTTAGFRLIVLDSVHWHYRNGTTDSNPAQKSWFESVLADAITQNLRVVCATHYTPQNGIIPVGNTGFNVLGTTQGANIADGWYSADEIFGCVDTFIGNGGKFMGWIMGHTHNDYFGTVYGHTSQPIVIVGTSKGSGSFNNKFIADTVSQDNFNIITFENLNSKDYIKIVKVGQDTDIYTRSKKTICYNFTDGVLISTT